MSLCFDFSGSGKELKEEGVVQTREISEGLSYTTAQKAAALRRKVIVHASDFEEVGTRAQTSAAPGILVEGRPEDFPFSRDFHATGLPMGDDVVCIDDDENLAPPSPANKARMELEAQQRRLRREEKKRQVILPCSLFCFQPSPSPSISLHYLPFTARNGRRKGRWRRRWRGTRPGGDRSDG